MEPNKLTTSNTSNSSHGSWEKKISLLKEQLEDLRLERESFIEDNPPVSIQAPNAKLTFETKSTNTNSSM